ncbi:MULTISPECIES: hypothetical protein [Bacillota]|uniref:hypothetical protein n=1 Tax=Bacillota TaxID=1239 RepID=UPI001020D947|nr:MULTISPECIES: hypothetical protein [Bacillota]KAA4893154.1 hypothetical protein F2033_22545 [Bacteroides fragilis]KAB5941265.1 hypothetical protein GA598_08685 [Bifidobacterium adolescentis]MTH39088.1 hypothetical protein [Veillonella dispar]MZM02211.1 hypothetical protein [Bifidobacterium pseudocatenulatum]KAB5973203.1 hypothetical protein GA569_10835 [Bifidobacterium adolescentis]
MKDFDSLGARQQLPEEFKPIGIDWQGNPLYPGDPCYLTEDGYVPVDDILEYAQQHYPKIELGGI